MESVGHGLKHRPVLTVLEQSQLIHYLENATGDWANVKCTQRKVTLPFFKHLLARGCLTQMASSPFGLVRWMATLNSKYFLIRNATEPSTGLCSYCQGSFWSSHTTPKACKTEIKPGSYENLACSGHQDLTLSLKCSMSTRGRAAALLRHCSSTSKAQQGPAQGITSLLTASTLLTDSVTSCALSQQHPSPGASSCSSAWLQLMGLENTGAPHKLQHGRAEAARDFAAAAPVLTSRSGPELARVHFWN